MYGVGSGGGTIGASENKFVKGDFGVAGEYMLMHMKCILYKLTNLPFFLVNCTAYIL